MRRISLCLLAVVVGLTATAVFPLRTFAGSFISDDDLRQMIGSRCPHCDSCKVVIDTFLECLHRGQNDPCDSQRCIENILNSASCREYPGEGADRCDTKPVTPATYEVRQIGRTHSCSSNRDWHVWRVLDQGCTTCTGGSIYRVRCDTPACVGPPFEPDSFVGTKHQCGC